MLRFWIATLGLSLVGHASLADQLDDRWQKPRDYFNEITPDLCAGKDWAVDALYKAYHEEDPVAIYQWAWMVNPDTECAMVEMTGEAAWKEWRGNVAKSARAGYPVAQGVYGSTLVQGIHGVSKDVDRGIRLLRSASRAGHSWSSFQLAAFYSNDTWVDLDLPLARAYTDLAGKQGYAASEVSARRSRLDARGPGVSFEALYNRFETQWSVKSSGPDWLMTVNERRVSSQSDETGGAHLFGLYQITIDNGSCKGETSNFHRILLTSRVESLKDRCGFFEFTEIDRIEIHWNDGTGRRTDNLRPSLVALSAERRGSRPQ
ncbi:MAG: hypothetical protein AAF641_10720 [Pseudomonadota bacterium]